MMMKIMTMTNIMLMKKITTMMKIVMTIDKVQRRLAFRLKCLGARLRVKAMQIWLDITSN